MQLTQKQTNAIDYLVLCSVTQGAAYPDAEKAVAQTIREDRRLRADVLNPRQDGSRPGARMIREAVAQTQAQWDEA